MNFIFSLLLNNSIRNLTKKFVSISHYDAISVIVILDNLFKWFDIPFKTIYPNKVLVSNKSSPNFSYIFKFNTNNNA